MSARLIRAPPWRIIGIGVFAALLTSVLVQLIGLGDLIR
jgi:hypothetical protein